MIAIHLWASSNVNVQSTAVYKVADNAAVERDHSVWDETT